MIALLLALACAARAPLATWERAELQTRVMLEPAPAAEEALTLHMLSVREGMTGATGAGGAACGCN